MGSVIQFIDIIVPQLLCPFLLVGYTHSIFTLQEAHIAWKLIVIGFCSDAVTMFQQNSLSDMIRKVKVKTIITISY